MTNMSIFIFHPDEWCLGGSESDMEGEDGEARGGHDSICTVSGCIAGLSITVNVYSVLGIYHPVL